VADVGIGAAGHRVTVSLALSAALGLALTAALWWAFFGTADDDRAARSLARADRTDRPRLVLAAYFYAYIPMLLGIVAIAAGLKTAIGHPGATLTAGPAVALAGGVTLFLTGDVLFRWVLRTGIPWYRAAAAVAALAAWPVATAVDAAAGIALLTAMTAAALVMEQATVKT
jgi:low temperature requirement protein LtrA